MGSWGRAISFVAVFAAGWAGAKLIAPAATGIAHAAPREEAPPTCSAAAELEANARLVSQVHDYRSRLALAESRRDDAEAKLAHTVANERARVMPSDDEWSRMAHDGKLRLREPCESYDGNGRFTTQRTGHRFVSIAGNRRGELKERAMMAGFTAEELESFTDVYARAHEATWRAMRAFCEKNDEFRGSEEAKEGTPSAKIGRCQTAMLYASEPSTRATLAHVTALRAAHAGEDRMTTDAERVAYVVTESPRVLDDEMVRTFGREKATRALDNGMLCFGETLVDLTESGPNEEIY